MAIGSTVDSCCVVTVLLFKSMPVKLLYGYLLTI